MHSNIQTLLYVIGSVLIALALIACIRHVICYRRRRQPPTIIEIVEPAPVEYVSPTVIVPGPSVTVMPTTVVGYPPPPGPGFYPGHQGVNPAAGPPYPHPGYPSAPHTNAEFGAPPAYNQTSAPHYQYR